MSGLYTIVLLVIANVFMTFAWYGHLKFAEWGWFKHAGLFTLILISWGIAFVEYCFQVPANRIGSAEHGGPFSFLQLKIIQEVITLIVFSLFLILFVKGESLTYNHLIGFVFLILAVYFIFKN